MENSPVLPPELASLAWSEPRDFVVESKRSKPIRTSLSQIFFGIAWILVLVSIWWKDLFSSGNFSSIFSPLDPSNTKLVLFVFILFWFLPLITWIFSLLKKWWIFLATPTRLLHYKNGKIESLEWSSFTGNIFILGNNLTLEMKSGKTSTTRTEDDQETRISSSRFVHDTLYIAWLNDVWEIARICRERIKEHNSNLPDTGNLTSIPWIDALSSLVQLFKK
jgi:hypothetical protein